MRKYAVMLLAVMLVGVMAAGAWAVSSVGENEVSVPDDVKFSQDIDAETTYIYEADGGGGEEESGYATPIFEHGCNSCFSILSPILTSLILLRKSRS